MAKIRANTKLRKLIANAQKIKDLKLSKPDSLKLSFKGRPTLTGQRINIYFVIKYGDAVRVFSTGESCPAQKLNTKTGEVLDQPFTTAKLKEWKYRAEQLAAQFMLTQRKIDLDAIRAALRGDTLEEDTVSSVQELYERYTEHEKTRLDTSQTAIRTYWKNIRWAKDFVAFSHDRYGPKAQLDDIKSADSQRFVHWLRKTRQLCNNTAQATASHARAMMNYAFDNDWIERNPFLNFRRKMDEVQRTTLSCVGR